MPSTHWSLRQYAAIEGTFGGRKAVVLHRAPDAGRAFAPYTFS
jgi:hypothetical protein